MRAKKHLLFCARVIFTVAAGFVACGLLSGCKKAGADAAPPKPVAPVAPKPVAVAASTNDMKQYLSVFEDLPPAIGKDPFFPQSHRRDPSLPVEQVKERTIDQTLILKGIVGSVSRRIAVINDETMQSGEESSVRTPGGHVRLKCLEIGEDYVLVQVEGEPQTRKLVMEQKK
jgi:hypothetical protein